MDVRVLEHQEEGADAVALLEQSHTGGPVLYLVTIVVLVEQPRRPPRRFTFAKVETDKGPRGRALRSRLLGVRAGAIFPRRLR